MVYDFDHYTTKSILTRAANPGQPMGQGRCPWAGTTIEKYVEDEKKRKERERKNSENLRVNLRKK